MNDFGSQRGRVASLLGSEAGGDRKPESVKVSLYARPGTHGENGRAGFARRLESLRRSVRHGASTVDFSPDRRNGQSRDRCTKRRELTVCRRPADGSAPANADAAGRGRVPADRPGRSKSGRWRGKRRTGRRPYPPVKRSWLAASLRSPQMYESMDMPQRPLCFFTFCLGEMPHPVPPLQQLLQAVMQRAEGSRNCRQSRECPTQREPDSDGRFQGQGCRCKSDFTAVGREAKAAVLACGAGIRCRRSAPSTGNNPKVARGHLRKSRGRELP